MSWQSLQVHRTTSFDTQAVKYRILQTISTPVVKVEIPYLNFETYNKGQLSNYKFD